MIEFQSLSLSGFKSFVDKTELAIASGLTGIVGPNGCGKSNLVEALRWAMGESSAKRMRGGDMDDVIFNGTSGRPARNFAEVVIVLNNGMHTAPAPYTAFDQIEISRRIEREQGSTYRVNGKVARARDVQLLLADTMTGANSPALVSQGKLTQIITAKPFDRRMILEESAGISGLHARRHEAELRLQAADNNLTRLQDSVGGLETQLNSLKRQSRQAEKYRVLTEEIKTLETEIAAIDWLKLVRTQQIEQQESARAEQLVADALLAVTQLGKTLDTQSQDLPSLRDAAAHAAARYQSVAIEIRQLETQEQQAQDAITDLKKQLAQTAQDIAHDQQVVDDGAAMHTALQSEEEQINNEQAAQEGKLPALEAARDDIAAQLESKDDELRSKTQILIETSARKNALTSQLTQERQRLEAARTRLADTRRRLESMGGDNDTAQQDDLASTIAHTEESLAQAQAQTPLLADAIRNAESEVQAQRQALQKSRDDLTKIQVERQTLESFLASGATATQPVLDDIKADIGFEMAIAKALGDTLFGSIDEESSVVWRGRDDISAPAFPSGVAPLDEKVQAPVALHAALGFIGYVLTRADGDAAAPALKPGQTIVSLDGYLWRWDGLFTKPSAKDKQAVILEQKNRLADLLAKLPALEFDVQNADSAFCRAEKSLADHRTAQVTHETELRALQAKLNASRSDLQKIMQSRAQQTAEYTRLTELAGLVEQDVAEKEKTAATVEADLAALDVADHANLERDVAILRDTVQGLQIALRDASLATDRYLQEEARRKARLHGIADQRIALHNRSARASQHLDELRARHGETDDKLQQILQKPQELADMRQDLMSRASSLEGDKVSAGTALEKAEKDVNETARALKEAEAILSNGKEHRAGTHARLAAIQERIAAVSADIEAQFALTPHDLMMNANVSFDMPDSDIAAVDVKRTRREKLIRDRESIGPVNLRADVEAQEIEAQLGKILTERTDLVAAIEELRGGIAKINVEARERLNQAFNTINEHFKDLFTRLFAGGQAHLQLIETDDPLGAGLEIYAQPPGKSLQSISLLSGGEQSLTAAALIFAMFLTNPSPICVLDEIDAPLDDANVDRICDLLRHITDICKTRFLVVTHHRLTMARMDRLYGVTMSEKGVSQLVSVDLSGQLDFLEAA